MYEKDNQKISAEIILLLPPFGKTIDVTEGAGVSEFNKRRLKPNYNWMEAGPGFYDGKWNTIVQQIPIRSYTTYTKKVISYGNRTEYTLSDKYGRHETWYDTSPETNKFTSSEKIYTMGVEYHLQIPCLDREKKKCGLPYTQIPPFPIDIHTFAPMKIRLLPGGRSIVRPIGPWLLVLCRSILSYMLCKYCHLVQFSIDSYSASLRCLSLAAVKLIEC